MNALLNFGTAALLAAAALLPLPAPAHEGHEHAAAANTPTLIHSSAHAEIVASTTPQSLVIYVDDFETNQPLTGLDIGVRSAGRLVKGQEAEPGLYRVPRDVLPDGATLALDISVHAASWDEHFSGSLSAEPAEAAKPARHAGKRAPWLAAGVLALAALGAAGLRFARRRRSRGSGEAT